MVGAEQDVRAMFSNSPAPETPNPLPPLYDAQLSMPKEREETGAQSRLDH